MNKQIISKAKELLKLGLLEEDGENAWKVDDAIVVLKYEQNHSYLSCSCESCTWSNNKGICHRKIAVILYQAQSDKFNRFTEALIKKYESFKKINMSPDLNAFIEDLKLIRGMK